MRSAGGFSSSIGLRALSLSLLLFMSLAIGFSLGAMAYYTGVATNLERSRDALLDQRAHLKQAANDIGTKIDALQRQLDIVNGYLRDNDRALSDVDRALRDAAR